MPYETSPHPPEINDEAKKQKCFRKSVNNDQMFGISVYLGHSHSWLERGPQT